MASHDRDFLTISTKSHPGAGPPGSFCDRSSRFVTDLSQEKVNENNSMESIRDSLSQA